MVYINAHSKISLLKESITPLQLLLRIIRQEQKTWMRKVLLEENKKLGT
jgi:hypothetical protein